MISLSNRIKVVLVGLLGLVTLWIGGGALMLLNMPSDAAVFVGCVLLGALFIGFPWCLSAIMRYSRKDSPHA